MNRHLRSLAAVSGFLVSLNLAGCGTINSLTDRLLHRDKCDCETTDVVTSESVPLGVPVGAPIIVPPPGVPIGQVIQGAPMPMVPIQGAPAQVLPTAPVAAPPAAPPTTSRKPNDDAGGSGQAAEDAAQPSSPEPLPPVQHPSPPIRKTPPATPEKAAPAETKKADQPPLLPPPPAVVQPPAKPAAIDLSINSERGMASLGDEVRYDLKIQNKGESAVEKVEMTATLSNNLKPLGITPEGSAKIQGNRVVFEAITNFRPQATLDFVVRAQVINRESDVGRVTVEVNSPTLSAGILKQEAATRLLPSKTP